MIWPFKNHYLFIYQAYQVNDPTKEASVEVLITFPGDELGPVFTQTEYAAELLQAGPT